MITNPVEEILPRNPYNAELTKVLNHFADLIDEVVNVGTHILSEEVKHSRGDENMPISMFFRNILEMIDSISLLVRNSSVDPCKILLRSILESFLKLEYMLEKDTKKRSLSFIVWDTHNNIKIAKKLKPGTDENLQLKSKYKNEKTISKSAIPPKLINVEKSLNNSQSLLTLPLYSEIEIEYQRMIKNGVKNPEWFYFFNGPKNIEQLALYLKRDVLYEILYRGWSGSTHGNDIYSGKLTPKGEVIQIRFAKDAQEITKYTHTIAFIIYNEFVSKRIPNYKIEVAKLFEIINNKYSDIFKGNIINIKY